MIWLNIKKLEVLLANSQLTEKRAFYYLLLNLIFIAIAMRTPPSLEFTSELWKLSDFFLDLGVTIAGTYLVFSINSKGDNRDFLKRYFSLGFVHALRLALLFVFLGLVYKIIMFVIPGEWWFEICEFNNGDPAQILKTLGFSFIYYWLLTGSFKRVNAHKAKTLQA